MSRQGDDSVKWYKAAGYSATAEYSCWCLTGVVTMGRRVCSLPGVCHITYLIAEQSVGREKADVNGNIRATSTRIVRCLVDNFARLGSISIYPGVSSAVAMGVTPPQVSHDFRAE